MNEQRQIALLTYLKGEPSDKDLEVIDKWKLENPQELEEYVEVWNKSGMLNDQIAVDRDRAWLMVQQRVLDKNTLKFSWLRVAAVISLLITTGLLLYHFWQKDQFSTTNQTKQLVLRDDSQVLLNTHTELNIINFDGSQRLLSLHGEAFFQVARDESRPFIIETPRGTVQVLGTAFNTLAADSALTVSVLSGVVKVSTASGSEILQAGESINISEHLFEKKANDPNFLAWKSGILKFTNSSSHYVLATLSKHFDVQFRKTDILRDCMLTATYDNLTLLQILEELELIWNVKFTVKDQLVEIGGEGCQKGGAQ